MSATFTTDFRHEFEQERERWLRKRFLWYSGVVIAISLFIYLGAAVAMVVTRQSDAEIDFLSIATSAVLMVMYVAAFLYAYRTLMSRERVLRLVFWLIVISGAVTILITPINIGSSVDRQITQLLAERAQSPDSILNNTPLALADSAPAQPDEVPQERPDERSAERSIEVSTNSGVTIEFSPDDLEELANNPTARDKLVARAVVLNNALSAIFVTHFFACLFLPWSPRESLRPIAPLLLLNALVTLWFIRLVPVGGTISILASPLVAAPGALICWWRQSRFKDRFHFQMLKGRYGEIKQELASARQIHESLYPKPLRDGPVRFEYRYEPMRQIGGDYLFAKQITRPSAPLPVLHLAIVDVTGHGITAALTVNRLHGEFERQFGENPNSSPGDILRGLNAYLHHTLASHSVYATAVCVRIDPNDDSVRWASAGHPPAFIRTVTGRIERLDSTTFVLGATRGDDFEPNEEHARFTPGDMLLLYTDGAIEARNDKGRMLRVEGLQRIIAGARPDHDGGFASAILREVDEFRFGPPQDDTLVVEVWRPVKL